MNDEELERKLRGLAAGAPRPDRTSEWKTDILARARASRDTAAPRAPRWLLVALGAAWLMIAVLHFTTPSDGIRTAAAAPAPGFSVREDTPLGMLMAYHDEPELLEFP